MAGDGHRSFRRQARSQQNRGYHTTIPPFDGGRGTTTPRNGRLSQEIRPELQLNPGSHLGPPSRPTLPQQEGHTRKGTLGGHAQTEVIDTLANLLTSPPILALPDWSKPFWLHTDASKTRARAVLTQVLKMVEKTLAHASHRWSKTDENKSPTNRECLAVFWAVDKFASYLQARPFTLITDCSALTWLFKSQVLSAKYHRWALRLMQYDMELQWRPGTKHQFTHALLRPQNPGSHRRRLLPGLQHDEKNLPRPARPDA